MKPRIEASRVEGEEALTPTADRRKKKVFLISFLAANLLLSAFYTDTWCTPNAVSRALPVLTWLQDGTLQIDKYADRTGDKSRVGPHFYSDKAPFPTLASIPIYWMMEK